MYTLVYIRTLRLRLTKILEHAKAESQSRIRPVK